MPIAQTLMGEFDNELANTRRMLEHIPADRFDWRPHEKSFTLGQLATHVADVPSWISWTFKTEELDFAPEGEPPMEGTKAASPQEVLAHFDRALPEARAALLAAEDTDYMVPWTLKSGGKTLFTMPRIAVYRAMIMNHLIHHRGQLSVYLRMCNIPLPAIYGPTADEQGF